MRNLIAGLGLVCLALGWNAPNHYPPWTTFHLELFAASGVCLLGAATLSVGWLSRLFGGRGPLVPSPALISLPLPQAAIGWLVAGLWPVVQYLSGGLSFRGDALIGLLYGLGTSLSVYIGLLWSAQVGRTQVMRQLWLAFVAGGLIAGGLALVQWLRLGTPGWWAMELIDSRPYAGFAQPNHFGLLMVMATVAVTALFESGTVQHRWVHGLAVAFFGWGVLISQSRASVLALIAIAACWLLTRHRVPTRLRVTDLVVALIAGYVLSQTIGPLEKQLLLQTSEARNYTEIGPRSLIWLHFLAAIAERPWLGYGFNQGVMALAEVADRVAPSRNVVFAHNVLLDLMAWVGIPLALLVTLALGRWMLGWLERTGDTTHAAQRHLVFAIWLALLIQSLLEFPYAHSYFLLPAALLAGAATTVPRPRLAVTSQVTFVASRTAIGLAAGASMLLGLLAWEYFQMEDDFRFNRFARANIGTQRNHESLDAPWILDQLAALNASATVQAAPGMSTAQIEKLRVLARRFHILSTRLEYAKALALNGQPAAAEAEMRIVRSVYSPAQYESIARQWQAWLAAQGVSTSDQ